MHNNTLLVNIRHDGHIDHYIRHCLLMLPLLLRAAAYVDAVADDIIARYDVMMMRRAMLRCGVCRWHHYELPPIRDMLLLARYIMRDMREAVNNTRENTRLVMRVITPARRC